MLRKCLMLVGLAGIVMLGSGGDDRSSATPGRACRTVGDLRLVYTGAAGEEGGDIFGLTRDGAIRRLTDDGGSFGPSFSPDGSKIVFSSIGEHGSVPDPPSDTAGPEGLDIHVMAADGSGMRRLDDAEEEDVSPAWSPDGDQIAFVRQDHEGVGRIFVVDPDAGRARALIEPDDPASDGEPAWSPDGTQLAFVRGEPDGPVHLMVADADGSGARSVLENPEWLASPSWSPDGTALAFTYDNDNVEVGAPVAVVDLDDGSVETVAEHSTAPVWSASGRLYGYFRAPGIKDYSGWWRLAELMPEGDRGFEKGRAISEIENMGLYPDSGVDVPRCDGPETSPLTTETDVPGSLVVTDPTTGEDVEVVPREQILALWTGSLSEDAELSAKLVHADTPGSEPLGLPEGRFAWVVRSESAGTVGSGVFNATTGAWVHSGGDESWDGLVDHAP